MQNQHLLTSLPGCPTSKIIIKNETTKYFDGFNILLTYKRKTCHLRRQHVSKNNITYDKPNINLSTNHKLAQRKTLMI